MSSTTNKKLIKPCDNSSNNNTNITMSQYQDFGQYIDIDPTLTGSPQKYECGLFDLLTGNDYLFNPDLSPTSSMTTPTLILDGISTPQDLSDSPLFNNNYLSSPSLDPAFGFFPDLTTDSIDPNASVAARRSLMQQLNVPTTTTTNSVPSVTIPVDDSPFSTIPVSSALSPALTIPWSTEVNSSSSTDDINASSMSPSIMSGYSSNNSPRISSTPGSSTVTSPSTPSILMKNRNRKRSISEMGRDPQVVADELALKRAKNTDAARRSRKRKVMKMEALERQVMDLKNENNDLQTRIAVLESEKKGLEVKNVEKEARITMLEQQLSEAHERLINRN